MLLAYDATIASLTPEPAPWGYNSPCFYGVLSSAPTILYFFFIILLYILYSLIILISII